MSTDRDTTRIVRSWLMADERESADRLLDAVLGAIDTTPQRRATRWPAWRYTDMSATAKFVTAAVAVAVLAVAGMAFVFGGQNIGVEPTGSPSPSADEALSETQAGPSPSAADPVARVPGEFTACLPGNTELRAATEQESVASHPDGDMTLLENRGGTWVGTLTATDERLSGRHFYAFDSNSYTLANGDPGPDAFADAHRIENDDGAWQGGTAGVTLPDGTQAIGATILAGEGAYAGLTAVLFDNDEPGCFMSFRGLIMEVPDVPVPATEE